MTQHPLNQSTRIWAMLCHLSALAWIPVSFILGIAGIPFPLVFFNIIIPLIVWWLKKNEHPFINDHGKESLNFQISLTIYSIIGIIVVMLIGGVTCGVGFVANSQWLFSMGLTFLVVIVVVGIIITILQVVFCSFAAFKAYQGEFYHYPNTIRFLR